MSSWQNNFQRTLNDSKVILIRKKAEKAWRKCRKCLDQEYKIGIISWETWRKERNSCLNNMLNIIFNAYEKGD